MINYLTILIYFHKLSYYEIMKLNYITIYTKRDVIPISFDLTNQIVQNIY